MEAPSLIYDGFTSGMHGGTKCLGKKPISTRFVVLPPWDNRITPIIITQWVNHFDNDLRLICFIDIPKNVFTPNLSNYYSFCWNQTWSVIIYIHPNSSFCCAVMKMWAKFFLGLQESRKQRATSKKYTMIPILQEVTNFSSVQRYQRPAATWIAGFQKRVRKRYGPRCREAKWP